MEVILELVENGEHSYFTINNTKTSIGRDEDCEITLADEGASKVHCSIEFINDQYWIIDEGSKNGTYINQTPIKRANLYLEDIIQIGDSYIRFASNQMSISLCQKLRRPGRKHLMNKSITFAQSSQKNKNDLIQNDNHNGAKEITGVEFTKKFKSPGKAIEKVTKKVVKKKSKKEE